VLQASIYGEPAFGITPVQLELLQAATEALPLSTLMAKVAGNGHAAAEVASGALSLLERGALDVLA
jgi:hypothetical protein